MTQPLRIISWNVFYPTFAADNSYVIKVLEELGPFEVICLQEYVGGADKLLARWMRKHDYEMVYLPFAKRGELSQGVMTAVRKGLAINLAPTTLRQDKPQLMRPFSNIRGLVSAEIIWNNRKLAVHNIHLTYARPHTADMRRREFSSLETFLAAGLESNPWLLCGDFNFFGADKRKLALTEKYPFFSGNNIEKTWSHRPKYSPIRANLDYAFWSPADLQVEASLADFETSDHRPIVIEVMV
jgi:endonuclease/exonuclease/phosphatase family metal-dependent hydrolase